MVGSSFSSNEFADRFAQHPEREFLSVGLATHHRFGEMNRLLGHDLRREWWLVRIDHRFDDDRSWRFERPLHDLGTLRGVVNPEPPPTARLGEFDVVDRLQLHTILGVAQEDQLLPLAHAQLVVLEHDHFYRQAIIWTALA